MAPLTGSALCPPCCGDVWRRPDLEASPEVGGSCLGPWVPSAWSCGRRSVRRDGFLRLSVPALGRAPDAGSQTCSPARVPSSTPQEGGQERPSHVQAFLRNTSRPGQSFPRGLSTQRLFSSLDASFGRKHKLEGSTGPWSHLLCSEPMPPPSVRKTQTQTRTETRTAAGRRGALSGAPRRRPYFPFNAARRWLQEQKRWKAPVSPPASAALSRVGCSPPPMQHGGRGRVCSGPETSDPRSGGRGPAPPRSPQAPPHPRPPALVFTPLPALI